MAEFVLQVKDIDASGKDYSFRLEPTWLKDGLAAQALRPDPAAAAGRLQVHAQLSGTDILITGRLQAQLIGECFRCLEDAAFELDSELSALLSLRSDEVRPVPGEWELTPEDLDRDFYSGEQVVLDELVRDQIILDAPMQPICSEGCQGIPIPAKVRPPEELQASGHGSRIDPRLAPLLTFNTKAKPSKE